MEPYSLFLFHEELNYFLPADKRYTVIRYAVDRRTSIKDAIEALGPPHTEIGSIVVDGKDKDFKHILGSRQRIDVYPRQPPVDVTRTCMLRPLPLPQVRFVVDVNVGKLARLLRMLGFDAAYQWSWRDKYIADLGSREKRIVLSKDLGLLKRSKVMWAKYIFSERPWEQVKEVLRFFGLKPPFALFTRCLCCNEELQPVEKAKIMHRLEPKTKKYYHEFRICPQCGRIYWPGSHQEKMLQQLEALRELKCQAG